MEVSNKFDKQFAGRWSISSDELLRLYPKTSIPLKNNLNSIKVLSQNAAEVGSSGLTRAAAGAILGFLVAGPVGTVLGAGAGAGGAKRAALETYSIIVSFKTGEVFLGDITAFELEALRKYLPPIEEIHSGHPEPIAPIAPLAMPLKRTTTLSTFPPAIKGRKTKRKPMGTSPMLACLDAPGDSEILRQFRWHLTTALDSLNTIKWRHYDQEVSQLSEVVECVLIAVSVTAGSMIGGTKDGNDKTKLQLYVSKIINGKQFEKAWSKPFFSASINITRAQRIITENYKPTKATVAREHTAKDETFAENKINNHLEEHLAMLKDLFDRKLIEDSEYKAARAKALEI